MEVVLDKINFNENTDLSILIAQRLRMLAVHNNTSNDIQISHSIQPRRHSSTKMKFILYLMLCVTCDFYNFIMMDLCV
jgi:hypothetical protein